MKTKKILLMMSVMIMILCFMSCEGTKNIYQTSKEEEVTSKVVKNPDKTKTKIFYKGDREIARQVLHRNSIIKTTGKIPDGIVKEYYKSGKLKEESNYKNGKLDCISKWYYENRLLKGERNYKQGKLDGVTKWYYESGALGAEFNYKNGKLEGTAKLYWENGNIKAIHIYKNSKREGINKRYYNSGELLFIETYKNGKMINRKKYDHRGNLVHDRDY